MRLDGGGQAVGHTVNFAAGGVHPVTGAKVLAHAEGRGGVTLI